MWAEPSTRTVPCSRSGCATAVGGKAIGHRCVGPGGALSTGRTPSPHPPNRQRRPSGGKPFKQKGGGGGKGGGKFFKKGGTPNKNKKGGNPPNKTHSLKVVISEEETVSKSVGISGPAHPSKEKYSLEGPPHPPKEKYSLQTDSGKLCSNPFTCYALGNGNGSQVDDSNKKYRVYTDTDSDGKTEIITDINCKFEGKVFAMEVKVDPGSETNCIPLSHFRRLFPQLCKTDGLPKETALEPTLAQFEAYDGGIMQAHGWTIMPTQNISTKKFHPVRYYVVEREDARILISHATASWLDLVKVLCANKAPKCKRQVQLLRNSKSPFAIILLSGPAHPPKEKFSRKGPPHPPKVKYTTEQLTITRLIQKSQQELKRQLLPATTLGGNDAGAGKLTGRLTGQWSIQLYSGKHLHVTASKIGKGKVGQPHHLQDWHTLPKRNILSVQQLAITVLKLISGPAHPPKMKYSPKHQNACTTSHRKTRKLSPSMLRVISSATKTPTRLLKPLHIRTCLAAGSTLSIINLARLPLTVLKT